MTCNRLPNHRTPYSGSAGRLLNSINNPSKDATNATITSVNRPALVDINDASGLVVVDDDDDDDDEVVVGVDCRTLVPEAAMQGYYNSMPP
jgi:hypothetical protein